MGRAELSSSCFCPLVMHKVETWQYHKISIIISYKSGHRLELNHDDCQRECRGELMLNGMTTRPSPHTNINLVTLVCQFAQLWKIRFSSYYFVSWSSAIPTITTGWYKISLTYNKFCRTIMNMPRMSFDRMGFDSQKCYLEFLTILNTGWHKCY